jgi:hypothetical protein
MGLFRSIFALVATLILLGINFYIYKRFLSKVDILRPYKKVVKFLIILISILELVFFVTLRSGEMSNSLFTLFSSFKVFQMDLKSQP